MKFYRWKEFRAKGGTWNQWLDHKNAHQAFQRSTKAGNAARFAAMDRSKVIGSNFTYGTHAPLKWVKDRERAWKNISDFGGHGPMPKPKPNPNPNPIAGKAAVAKLKRKALIERNRQAALKRRREHRMLVPKHVIDLTK